MLAALIAQVREFGPGEVGTEPGTEDVATLKGLEAIFNNVISVALALAGIILFLMLIAGGFRYLTSGGDPKNVEVAKKTLTYAIGGIIFIALAFLILRFIETFTGAPVTEFRIFQPLQP